MVSGHQPYPDDWTGRKPSPALPRKHPHAKRWFEPCRKSPGRGPGGYPHPPPLLSIKVGGTLPPLCRANWGVPPTPPAPGRANRHIPGKCRKTRFPAGDSTRSDGLSRAGKVPVADLWGEGVPPTPLPSFRSKWGAPSPPCAGPGGGYPLPSLHKTRLPHFRKVWLAS